jgi:phage tail sheath protein FI
MCLLRRLALRRGAVYVFEPNGATLRRTVERGFQAVLDDLFRRGAFAGAQAADAYRVEVGDVLNTPQRRDLGQFWVELKVAPALPLSFLTVRVSRHGERVVSREVH